MTIQRRTIVAAVVGVVIASAAGVGAMDGYQHADFSNLHFGDPLPIQSVRVGGQLDHVSQAELERVVDPFLGDGFFSTDVNAIANAARALPWVASISVRRVWPDSLHIAVIERQAVARWGVDGLVSRDGEVFRPKLLGPVDHLPQLVGPPGHSHRVLSALATVTELLDGVGGGVARLAVNERGVWRVQCANGVEVTFSDDQFGALAELAQLYEPLLGRSAQQVAGIDLRYTNGFAVRWKEGTETGPNSGVETASNAVLHAGPSAGPTAMPTGVQGDRG